MMLYKLYEKLSWIVLIKLTLYVKFNRSSSDSHSQNAYTAFLFIPNQKPNAIVRRDQGELGIQKWCGSQAPV